MQKFNETRLNEKFSMNESYRRSNNVVNILYYLGNVSYLAKNYLIMVHL